MLHVIQRADHFANGDLALLLVLVRLNRRVAIHLGERHYIVECSLTFFAFTTGIEFLRCFHLFFGTMQTQRKPVPSIHICSPLIKLYPSLLMSDPLSVHHCS